MFDTVLVANRGAIACRIFRTLRRLGLRSVAVHTDADAGSLHVRQADVAVRIGEGPAAGSYLDVERVLDAARRSGAGAIHPGYGFLSENAAFAEACAATGLVFVGPTPAQIRAFGLKHVARELAVASGLPLAPGTGVLESVDAALRAAATVGYPVMLKSSAGGGGIGMQRCADAAALEAAFGSVQRLSRNNFGSAALFLERCIDHARHVEVQVFGDGEGGVLALGERDCSVQRRNQKVIEETPAPNLPGGVRAAMHAAAIALMARARYRSAGTVEFIYDAAREEFHFLEVNTRLQVEHGVTELVYGVDLVEWMLRLANGTLPPLAELGRGLVPRGHAVQARLYAEDPARGFRPSTGLVTEAAWPAGGGLRVDTWVEAGTTVPAYYDPMLAKLISHGPSREAAIEGLDRALRETRLAGIESNRTYLSDVLALEAFRAGAPTTRMLEGLDWRSPTIEVLAGGTQTTVQDHPGRVGHWDVGIPPSGPFDDRSFRLANRLLGNDPGAAGIEYTLQGPTLRFEAPARVMLAGARFHATLDGRAVDGWRPLEVPAGATLAIGGVEGGGVRGYLCIAGGLALPAYLGSRATFTLGGFGGHGGRALRAGDVLHLAARADGADGTPGEAAHEAPGQAPGEAPSITTPACDAATLDALRPRLGGDYALRVVYGPHGAPDFLTEEDVASFFASRWEVHYNSSRTGVRLVGPKPRWARPDGGEAGLHPSNIHDNAYAVGTVDFTGDMPIILGPDGPSLGGFVCPATVILADLWLVGQLKAGDGVRFVPVGLDEAVAIDRAREREIATLRPAALAAPVAPPPAAFDAAMAGGSAGAGPAASPRLASPVLRRRAADARQPEIVYRPSGEDYLLVEFGPLELDIALRARVHAWMQWLGERRVAGLLEMTPGIRSLQLHYDWRRLPLRTLLALLAEAEEALADLQNLVVPSRIVHLPLSWDDPSTRLAIEKYHQVVRRDAPWYPSNIEFIRRINGLDSTDAVRRIVFDASYLVLGLGDVYLGAPVATPLDPRHRLVTTKYNPARTWTPENAVGIGGAYLCVYGMEGPGGYQFIGRTVQMWNRFRRTREFAEPWLLRFFDQLRFFPVEADELLEWRADFPLGRRELRIEPATFDLAEYQRFLARHHDSIAAFRACQREAFAAERARWAARGDSGLPLEADAAADVEAAPLPPGCVEVVSPVAGSLWQLPVAPGERVAAGQTVAIVESMKMEITVTASQGGVLESLSCAPGATLQPGRRLAVIRA